ncbi:wax ester/triacylglycerol synthase domain-containing protein [Streptomyces sp. NPDC019937]|uniref:wax ester/triacylglycerol synthase domain-containing protein n=1 Tax=Streptomyces sp. NPDC019937 TaxID=3154787 RepID=UPI0033F273B2
MDRAFTSMGVDIASDHHLHHTLVLRLPGEPPGLQLLQRHVAARIERLPALTVRLGARNRRWTAGPPVRIADQVRALAVPPGGVAALEHCLAGQDLPEGTLWSLTLAHGYADDEYALCYHSHHAFQDGQAAMHVLQVLFGVQPDVTDTRDPGPRWRAVRAVRPAGLAAVMAGLARSLLPAPHMSEALAGGVRGIGRSSPATTERRVGSVDVDGLRMHRLARRAHVSVNDIYLTCVAAALTEHAGPQRRHACVPLDLRGRGEDTDGPGNCLGMARVALGEGPEGPTPAEVCRASRHTRSPHYRAAMRALLDLAPGPVARWATRHLLSPGSTQLVASYMAFPRSLAFAGRTAHDVYAIPPLLPGHVCFSVLSTYGRKVRVAFSSAPGDPEPQCLTDAWYQALERLEALSQREP